MKVVKLGFIVGAVVMASAAFAKPQWMPIFAGAYKAPAGSALADANCKVCHSGVKDLNPYGKDVKAALKKAKATDVTPAMLKSIESLDSDKDGVKNGAELKAGTLPGDPKSKPAKAAKGAKPAGKKK